MKLERLRGRKICERVLRQGRVWKGKHMTVRSLSGVPRHPHADPSALAVYLGTLASSKLDKSAVRRNRMRRRCREAWRLELREHPDFPSQQLLIAPRSSSLSAPFDDIRRDVRAFLSSLSHARQEAPRR
ncbi:MAG: ribonuclease P protein component [Candidatus Peribacteraceae bacterium]|nr:ribonuclease P protein component [Candidatus Peribacteraceae bacterium]